MRSVLFAGAILVASANSVWAVDAPKRPWVEDNTTISVTVKAVHSGGMEAVGPHVADLEKALARAKQSIDLAAAGDTENMYVLLNDPDDAPTDAQQEVAAKAKKKLLADPNPYLEIAFFLASYYDLDNKPGDALRVIDLALALPGSETNPHRFDLLSKRGAELGALKRWPEALAAYDEALKNEDSPAAVRAYMDRGRGMALYELGRKREAKDAYLEALKLVGNDPQAKKELEYIEQNQDGGEKLPPSVKAFQVPADMKPSDAKPADQPAPPKP
jgi:tetratricopeptide (TPR) repeat protein